ncbi:MAG: InlB B-repeat-containing protein [Saccharofermentanales bacterium]
MKKRILGLLLCLVMALTLVPALAMAAGYTATVSFDLNGHGIGEAPPNQIIPNGGRATIPEEPVPLVEDKVNFAYWTEMRNYALTRWDFNEPIYSDMTLYAYWFPWATFALQLSLNGEPYSGATVQVKNLADQVTQTITEGEPGNYPIQLPEGRYTFYVNGESKTTQDIGKTHTHTTYFYYYCTMDFDANGQIFTSASAPARQIVEKEKTPRIPSAPAATDAGKGFIGWTKGPGTGSGVYDFEAPQLLPKTAYAQWTTLGPGQYPVAIYGAEREGGLTASGSSDYQVTLKPPAAFEYPCSISGIMVGGQEISSGQYFINSNTGQLTINKEAITGPVEIFASMPLRPYVMTYDANGGTGTMNPGYYQPRGLSTIYFVSSCFFTGPPDRPYFKGWSHSADGSSTLFPEGYWYFYPKSDLTFYAIWWSGVNSVTLSVRADSAVRGETSHNAASAQVKGASDVSQEVTWQVVGASSQDTMVSPEGHVSVGLDETADEVTIRATSVADPAHYDELTVPVKSRVFVENGSSGSKNLYANGERVTITANEAPQDMVFDKWLIIEGHAVLDHVFSASTAFTMARENVRVEATYKSALPGIEGPLSMTLTEGYTDAVWTAIYQLSGTPLPQVTLDHDLGGLLTWDQEAVKLTLAPGLSQGNYQVTLTASNGLSPDAVLTFSLTVNGPPSISGDATMVLIEGYPETRSKTYDFAGVPAPEISFSASHPNISWDSQTNEIVIAPGLEQGIYAAALTAVNGFAPDADLIIQLTVKGPPTISGDTDLTLLQGYLEARTDVYTFTGLPEPEIGFSASDPRITWDTQTNEIVIAPGLGQGNYTATFTAANGYNPDAELTFHLTVTGPPSISGDKDLTLVQGYEAASTNAYKIAGLPAPAVRFIASDPAITWDRQARRIDIAPGLIPGDYTATLTVSNGLNPSAILVFKLTVTEAPANQDPDDPEDPQEPTAPGDPGIPGEPDVPGDFDKTDTDPQPSGTPEGTALAPLSGLVKALIIGGIAVLVSALGYGAIRFYGRKKKG